MGHDCCLQIGRGEGDVIVVCGQEEMPCDGQRGFGGQQIDAVSEERQEGGKRDGAAHRFLCVG